VSSDPFARDVALPAAIPPKMADIARLAGVSASTVSRALADNPLIPEAKRLEIQKIAADAGYVVNQSARSLRLRRTETIAVVLPIGHEASQLITDPFFLEMFGHLADAITLRDYQVLITRMARTSPGWLDRIVRSQRQDGIIVIGQSDQHEALNETAARYPALVVWGGQLPGQRYCSVGSDNAGGARQAVAHLIQHGRRRIAFLGQPELPEINLRHRGYEQALRQAGIEPDPALVIPAHFTTEAAYEAARALVASGTPFDAVFAASDLIAIAAIKAFTAAGLRVPEDVSVIGFDDIAMAATASPPLTTVRQDLGRGARTLVDLLFRRIAGEDTPSATLPPELVIRASCGSHR
jgi:DNA-binding LacI/PurR family transcriptional regulator